MENQEEIMEVVGQGSSKKGFGKLALVAAGVAAAVGGAIFFWKKRKAKQQSEEVDVSEDSIDESNEN